ncbi:ABC transporter permease [Natrarchaeobius chitinivorans]|uniref:ABC transporter permease n=1 Tax=Natrarchaeobius chitinivorans TaxID=1679083 RepID=A0A3N6MCB3_NATCH|nr:ABC transporter permease [Natrarchaeobius chitinivorans]RQG94160.1 ABC transporter permease [Natrarchaeobius chitinivorans]
MINSYYVQRTAQAIFTVFAVITITFVLIRQIPGGPTSYVRSQLAQQSGSVDMEQINTLVEAYTNVRPDEPLYVQYFNYITSVAQGDLGTSMYYSTPVSEIMAAAVPWTVFVMSVSLVLTFGIGISLGALTAYVEGSRFDVGLTLISIFLNSIPYYVLAIILVYALGYQLDWFPIGGLVGGDVTVGLNLGFIASAIYHAALPIASFVVTGFGIQALTMRGNSIRVLGEDYIRVARLRGIPPSEIALQYVGRNAILPMYTGMMISIGFMFGGSIIMEEIFAYPGVGYYMFRAISASDYPLMMGAFLIITIAVVLGIFVADLTYGKIDPRAGQGGNRESY